MQAVYVIICIFNNKTYQIVESCDMFLLTKLTEIDKIIQQENALVDEYQETK